MNDKTDNWSTIGWTTLWLDLIEKLQFSWVCR